MKKFLFGSVAFLIFAIAVSLLQSSCGKDAIANPDNNVGATQLNKILYIVWYDDKPYEIWIANYDGTGRTRVNVTIPSGYRTPDNIYMSPDGKRIFLGVEKNSVPYRKAILSCNVDGTNVVEVIGPDDGEPFIQGVY